MSEGQKFCTECGKPATPGSEFCLFCDAPLEEEDDFTFDTKPTQAAKKKCPICGGPLRFIQRQFRYYCDACQKMV